MNKRVNLNSGLYVTATPIGNLGDVSERALQILASVDAIACEDTRVSKKLLSTFGINKPCFAYHEHNAQKTEPAIIERIEKGEAIALISDAGTPLISDPGYSLVAALQTRGLSVFAVPGPSALMAALSVAGLPTDRFLFEGFLPAKSGARKKALRQSQSVDATLVFFESPNRLLDALNDLMDVFGDARQMAVCREMTKIYEEVQRGTAMELVHLFSERPSVKGEIVLVVGPPAKRAKDEIDIDAALAHALETLSVKEASSAVSFMTGVSKRDIYKRALELKGK